MNKKFESNGNITENPFEVRLVKDNGELEDFYLIKGNAREKIKLSDLINDQVDFVKTKDIETLNRKDYAQIGSSGNHAQIGSSGYDARIGSSGYHAQIGSSGNYAWIDVKGNNGVAFACGIGSVVKAKKGTWISLCEYAEKDGKNIPVFALSGQIGNKDYVDCKGEVLSEDEYYILKNKKFTPVIIDDGLTLIKGNSKVMNGVEVIKCKNIVNSEEVFCVRKGDLSAHGETLHQAMSDLAFKEMQDRDVSEIVEKIKECGYVTREDYRCITGACAFGTEQFAKEHGYADAEKVELNELLSKLDDRYYGAVKFKELLQQN